MKFWDTAILQTEVGQVEVEIRTAHVLAWMLRDKNTWLRNSKNHHSTAFLPSSGTKLVQSLHHNTSHYITSHAYTYTHALYLNFSRMWIFPFMPSEWSLENSTDHVQKVFSRGYIQRPLKSKILPFLFISIRLSTSIFCQAGLELVSSTLHLLPLNHQFLFLGKHY